MKREITYTVYGDNIENTLKLLKCNKNVNLIDQKNDVKTRRFFVTSSSSKKDHRAVFGQTKDQLIQNLN